jgi:cell fate regulator YaaT (PSP1 superfamily)
MKIAGFRFHIQDKIHDLDQKEFKLEEGDAVVVESGQGNIEAGEIVYCNREVDEKKIEGNLGIILRKATTTDLDKVEKYKKKGREAILKCREEIKNLELPLKLVDLHFSFDGSRITVYFTAEERIDFRELVKRLTRKFQKSVRMQQIGSRDVASVIGGYGICGKGLCCFKFLESFQSITTDMVKLQQIAQGNEKISGACGRLMCCLGYEADYYEKMNKKMPAVGLEVKTGKGRGRVVSRNLLNKTLEVEFSEGEKSLFQLSEIKW